MLILHACADTSAMLFQGPGMPEQAQGSPLSGPSSKLRCSSSSGLICDACAKGEGKGVQNQPLWTLPSGPSGSSYCGLVASCSSKDTTRERVGCSPVAGLCKHAPPWLPSQSRNSAGSICHLIGVARGGGGMLTLGTWAAQRLQGRGRAPRRLAGGSTAAAVAAASGANGGL